MKFKFDAVFYYVSDLDRAVGFYADALGLELHSRDLSDNNAAPWRIHEAAQ